MKVREIMTEEPIVAHVPGTRTEVLKVLVRHNITGVPVVKSADGTLAGFVTRQDIFSKPEEEQLALVMRRDYPTIGPEEDVRAVARSFAETKLRHLPVVEQGRLIGLVTPTDLLLAVEKSETKKTVEEVAHSPCIPIYEGAPLAVALATFKAAGVNALAVLNDQGMLAGIVTDRDIFNQAVVNGSVAMADLGIGGDEDDWTWEGLRNVMKLWYEVSKIELPKLLVREVMVRKPMTVFRRTPVTEAAKMMRKNDFGQLPISDVKDTLVGIVYDLDVITTLL